MKHRYLQRNCLLVLAALLAALALPCSAMTRPQVNPVSSFAEFMARYHSEAAEDARTYMAKSPLVCLSEVILSETPGTVELVATSGICVAAGGSLTLNNPNLLVMGPPPVITVEAGGVLRILDWSAMMADGSMPTDAMIVVEADGELQLGNGITLPDGMVIDRNGPDDTVPPPVVPSEPEPEPKPDPEPETPAAPFALTGEVMQVSPEGKMTVYLTMPRLPEETKSFCVQRSTNGTDWMQVLTFRLSATVEDSTPQWEAAENPLLLTKHSDDGRYTFLPYLEPVSDKAFFLRVVLEEKNDKMTVSQPVKIYQSSGNTPNGDYDGSSGNQGGGGQGQSDRPGQQTPPTTAPSDPATQMPEPQTVPEEVVPQDLSDNAAGEESAQETADVPAPSDLSSSDGAGVVLPQELAAGGTTTYLSAQRPNVDQITQPDAKSGAGEAKPVEDKESAEPSDSEQDEASPLSTAAESEETQTLPQTMSRDVSASKGNGDQGGYAALASLTLCGCAVTAGSIHSKQKRNQRGP